MNIGHSKRKAEPHIPFIALADIAWQIIIFFLVASSFANKNALNVDLPSASKDKATSKSEALTVIAGESILQLNDKAVELADLQETLARKLEGKTDDQERAVVIVYKDDLTFQRNADILYAVQKANGIVVFSPEESGTSDKK